MRERSGNSTRRTSLFNKENRLSLIGSGDKHLTENKYLNSISKLESKLASYEKTKKQQQEFEDNSFLKNVNEINQQIEKQIQVSALNHKIQSLEHTNAQLLQKVMHLQKQLEIQRKLKYFWVDRQPGLFNRYP